MSSQILSRFSLRLKKIDSLCVARIMILTLLTVITKHSYGESQQGRITLQSNVSLEKPQVTIGDVATIQTSDALKKVRIEALDLHTLSPESPCVLSSEFIRLRLALADLEADSFEFAGPSQVIVLHSSTEKGSVHPLERQIAQLVADRVDRATDEVRVRLLQPQTKTIGRIEKPLTQFRTEITLPEGSLLGRHPVSIRVYDEQKLLLSQTIPVEIAILQTELRITQAVSRGESISPMNITSHQTFMTTSPGSIQLSDVIGCKVKRSLKVGDRISKNDLVSEIRSTTTKEVMKARSAIRLIAKLGRVEITVPMAEALQQGAVGQVIRVKNLQSNRIVNARVISPEEAIVDVR